MKYLSSLIFLLFANFYSYGQIKTDPVLLAFAKSEGFVCLNDPLNMPGNVMAYYKIILKHFKKRQQDISKYYINSHDIKDTNTSLEVEIVHYDGFKLRYDQVNKKIKFDTVRNPTNGNIELLRGVSSSVFGNLSGKDGILKINKTNMSVTFYLWQ